MRKQFPENGVGWQEIEAELGVRAKGDANWREGRTAVYVFNAGDDVHEVGKNAYNAFMSENALGPAAFPSIRSMEDDVVGFGLDLMNAPDEAVGDMTSGGTDSITMAIKTCRDWWRAQGRDTTGGQILAASTAHPAFNKAAHLMDLEVVRVPVGADLKADVDAMAGAVTDRTLMIVGSAPCFPYGLIDPIPEIAALAADKGIWCHVDACVGGYFAPFARMNGVDVTPFGFESPGVSSISADLHKYGYAPKGASTVFYRSEDLRQHQAFSFDVWPNGRMTTPTLAGTRPGGAIAGAWAVLRYLGEDGYRAKAEAACSARATIGAGAADLGFETLGDPVLGLITFGHTVKDTHAIADDMRERGWVSSRVAQPDGIHLMLSPAHIDFTGDYLADLAEATEAAPIRTADTPQRAGFYN